MASSHRFSLHAIVRKLLKHICTFTIHSKRKKRDKKLGVGKC